MKLIFAGTPEFAAVALQALIDAGHHVELVLTQPDRPSGRGMALQRSPVKQTAESLGIEVFQPLTLRESQAQDRLRATSAELMVVAAYGLILPQAVLDIPRLGCINIHASLLPRWRGAAPIQRAILAGDGETGVCIMRMEAGLDTGPVVRSGRLPIEAHDTTGSLHDKLAALGAQLMVETLERWPLPMQAQPEAGVTYAAKIAKVESVIDWTQPALQVDRQIRAFNPIPGASTVWNGCPVKVWQATAEVGVGQPGTVLAAERDGIVVACGEGAIRLTELQRAGGKRMSAAQFLAGMPIAAGGRFDAPT